VIGPNCSQRDTQLGYLDPLLDRELAVGDDLGDIASHDAVEVSRAITRSRAITGQSDVHPELGRAMETNRLMPPHPLLHACPHYLYRGPGASVIAGICVQG
jgi:hypothetical protein